MKPTVCLGYIHNGEPYFLFRSRMVMKRYPWITKIVMLCTNRNGKPSDFDDKSYQFCRDFGEGFDKQPEDGGFHELAARNYLMSLCYQTGCDWTLVCDPDEFFTFETFTHIQRAHNAHKQYVWFSCYNFCSPTEYLWFPNQVIQTPGGTMHEPHPRAVRNIHKPIYRINANWQHKVKNRTMHCHMSYHPKPLAHFVIGGIQHVHTHYMFDPKRPDKAWLDKHEKRQVPAHFKLPDVILKAWETQEG